MLNNFIKACLSATAFAASGVFDYKQNGADWGSMSGNELCDHGSEQSPINFDSSVKDTWGLGLDLIPNTYIDYTTAVIEKLDHTIQVAVALG